MAALFRLNVKTLRYYDEIGLLKPAYVDPVSGYRYYAVEQFEQLNSIRYLRTQGMSLQDIDEGLEHRDPVKIRSLLVQQLEKVTCQIETLENTRRRLTQRVAQLDDAMDASRLDRLRLEVFEERPMAVFRKTFQAGDCLEMPLRTMEIRNQLQPSYFLGKVGISMSLENLMGGDLTRYQGLFCLLEAGERPDAHPAAALPAGLWALWRFHGSHRDARAQYRTLLARIEAAGLKPCGNAAEFSLMDAGLTEEPSAYITEIQIPVKTA